MGLGTCLGVAMAKKKAAKKAVKKAPKKVAGGRAASGKFSERKNKTEVLNARPPPRTNND